MALWPLRVYSRKKRAGQRLNLTPAPDRGPPEAAEALPGPSRRPAARCRRGRGRAPGLRKIAEKAERSGQGGRSSGLPSSHLGVSGEKSLRESSTSEEETEDEKMAPWSDSMADDLQVDSSSTGELVSGSSLQHDISSSLLSYSITDSSTEFKGFEENLSSFPSPELFRGSDYLDWEHPKLEEYMQCKNSTLLDTSKAVAIENAPQFSNLSAILDNAACEVLAEKTYPLTPEKTKKKPGKDPEPRDTNFQTKLSSHLKIKVPSSQQRSVLESNAGGKSVTSVLLPQPLEPALNTNPTISDKKSRGLLTSTPTSQTADLEIDLSSVQKSSFEELFPNVSSCVNSDEIVPVSSSQENSSNEVPLNKSEICCIIRASPGTRQLKSKGVIVKKKKYSLPKDIPQGTVVSMQKTPLKNYKTHFHCKFLIYMGSSVINFILRVLAQVEIVKF
ncbi:meiosis-specific kinetochore protein [Pipistrellus kuhlii]|uniref:meiosis-specific kinetochore protein n=1 Tax=Pipistrellus kuhlii TaxID=59472 RepID=UPI001E26EA37|nr:meiosis-specific kinetochore protein [Pipistrellus kuhlii]